MGNKWRVLIADDHIDTVDLLKFKCELIGCDVRVAYNGEEAVQVFTEDIKRGQEFDFCVLDYQMPRMKGDVAAVTMREICHSQGLECPQMIMFTGSTDRNLISRFNTARLGIVLTKPFGFEQLERFITRIGSKENDSETRDIHHRNSFKPNPGPAHHLVS